MFILSVLTFFNLLSLLQREREWGGRRGDREGGQGARGGRQQEVEREGNPVS